MSRETERSALEAQRGFTIFEVVLATAFVALGVLLVTETLGRTQGAAEADGAKSKAVLNGDKLLRRLTVELAQTSSQVDVTLPPAESQRLWLNAAESRSPSSRRNSWR